MLTEMFNEKCLMVSKILAERDKLLKNRAEINEVFEQAERSLDENNRALQAAIRERDSLSAALSVAPEIKPNHIEELRENRQKVFAQMQQVPGIWLKPEAISILSGVDSVEVSAILRRACKIDGIPLQHNGDRGRGSSYKWIGHKE